MSVAELTGPQTSSLGEEEEPAEKTMTIIEHLEELRFRLTVSVVAILVGMVPGWFLAGPTISFLREPIQRFGPLHFFGPLDAFTLNLKIAALAGVAFALPVLLYQMWAFISPGLTKRERKRSLPFVLLGLVLFGGGAYTGYRILPLAFAFLLGFQSQDLAPMLGANQYIGFIALILLVFGIAFELPLVLVFLCSIDVISSRWLFQKLKYAIVIIFIVSTIITPGADPISPLVLGTIMSGLYLLAIVLARTIGK